MKGGEMLESLSAKSIVAVEAHPDDVELGCLGTLLAYQHLREVRISIAALTLGDRALTPGTTKSPEEISAERFKEATAVAGQLNGEFHYLGQKDCYTEYSPANPAVEKLTRLLRDTKADLVIAPPQNDYHHDHLMASQIAEYACVAAITPSMFQDSQPLLAPPRMLYVDPITGLGAQPTVYIDITPFFEKKCELLRLHKSQMEYMAKWASWDLVDYAEIVNRFRGLQCGVKYAEAFSPVLSYTRLRPEPNLP